MNAQEKQPPLAAGDLKLPPPHARLLADCLGRKFLSSAGEKWIPRFCVLCKDRLTFAKLHNAEKASQWVQETDDQALNVESLRAVFQKHDVDKSG